MGQLTRVAGLAVGDQLVHRVLALGPEGRHSGQHLKQQHANAPPVHRLAMAVSRDHLRSHVLHNRNKPLKKQSQFYINRSSLRPTNIPETA